MDRAVGFLLWECVEPAISKGEFARRLNQMDVSAAWSGNRWKT